MEVYEKINHLIREKGLSKKEFVKIFLSLEPRLKRTGEIPRISTVYGYLNGLREIKIELIPFFAEALNVKEQELFDYELEYATDYNYKYSKEAREIIALIPLVPKSIIQTIHTTLKAYRDLHEKTVLSLENHKEKKSGDPL